MDAVAAMIPVALGVIMFGLGMSLTAADFARVVRHPRVALIALTCQVILLPLVCWGIVVVLGLPPVFAVGMLLLAASPGGAAASLWSHLFGGDVALNISLTAVSSVLSVVTLPLITNLALTVFYPGDAIGLQWAKVVEFFVIVLGPVALGMLVRRLLPRLAARVNRAVKLASVLVLIGINLAVIIPGWSTLVASLGTLAAAVSLFSATSFTIGYFAPRLLRVLPRQAVATSFEIGIHNAGVAIFVGTVALGDPAFALPGALYGILMNLFALGFGFSVARRVVHRNSVTEGHAYGAQNPVSGSGAP
ncbi:bile acid:sodium symporter family protein [Microbacterium sp.]|uniref:bile acid:sodium symporter family protein n=1 Tax=Microbacterium sp. TaxID=51671 RepID=UPI003C7235A5